MGCDVMGWTCMVWWGVVGYDVGFDLVNGLSTYVLISIISKVARFSRNSYC